MKRAPFQLCASLVEKIWGVSRLEPWFLSPGGKVGEAWYALPDGQPLPILVKLIFTSDRLSVQVHPDEAYARAHEGCGGKSEMWYVLAAEPGARLALGFVEPVTRQRARQAASSGDIERLLHRLHGDLAHEGGTLGVRGIQITGEDRGDGFFAVERHVE